MGGAGCIFTGEHDAVVMHNSATINLNMLEFGARAGVKRFFILPRPVSIPNTINWTPTTRLAPKRLHTRRLPTASMDGRSCSANVSIWPT
jgi:hypothetical protein